MPALPSLALSLLLPALLRPAHAQAPQPTGHTVLVSPFQARTRSGATQAALLPAQVSRALAELGGIEVRPIEDVPPVSDMAATTYASTCPPGQYVGCAFVLGDTAGVDVALAGAVEVVGGRNRVELHIIDMRRAEDVLAFEAEFDPADEQVFASAVAGLVRAVARGEAGLKADIRAQVDPSVDLAREREREIAAAQLSALQKEIGGSESVEERGDRTIVREKISAEDLVEQIQSEGSKPWDRLDMTMGEYVRYRNSGFSLLEWKTRSRGRQGQIILRPALGVGRSPSGGHYYGQVVKEGGSTGFATVESYAWQATTADTGLLVAASASYGILPGLEAGLQIGRATGTFVVQVDSLTVNQSSGRVTPTPVDSSSWYIGPAVLASFMPTSFFRPVVGGQLSYWSGKGLSDFEDAKAQEYAVSPDDYPRFPSPWLLTVGATVGAESRMNQNLDLFLHVPVNAVVASKDRFQQHTGEGNLQNPLQPPAQSTLTAALLVGVQIRFLGGLPEQKGIDDYEDPYE